MRGKGMVNTQSVCGLFGDNRNLRFCALTSVGVLFYFVIVMFATILFTKERRVYSYTRRSF